ncbi:MAG: gas vesicle protein GvpJ [candidate division Zixibacteria bacterium]|nr:gas vesicle protein GvpJ [candidate division Zixibacteria bacterium]
MAKHPLIKTPCASIISPMGRSPASERVTLVEALDKVLEKGAVINGDVVIRVADVDLVYLGLRLILTSVSKAEELSGEIFSSKDKELTPEDIKYIEKLKGEIRRAEENIPKLIDASDPKKAEQGLAKLVLTLVELIRKLMEKEAFRRMKRGTLSPAEIQKLGLSLKAVKKKIKEIQAIFGIEDEELNLDLGPLGNLM